VSVFVRFGRWREHESSFNSQTEEWEEGVSVFRLVGPDRMPSVDYDPQTRKYVATERLQLDLRGLSRRMTYNGPQVEATLYSLITRALRDREPTYLVTGRVVGKGGDGEPLLRDVVAIREVGLNDLSDNKGQIDRILHRGRHDQRTLLKKRSTPRDETLYFWTGGALMETSKWDVEDGLEPAPVYASTSE
jgi:hypothetical protein